MISQKDLFWHQIIRGYFAFAAMFFSKFWNNLNSKMVTRQIYTYINVHRARLEIRNSFYWLKINKIIFLSIYSSLIYLDSCSFPFSTKSSNLLKGIFKSMLNQQTILCKKIRNVLSFVIYQKILKLICPCKFHLLIIFRVTS